MFLKNWTKQKHADIEPTVYLSPLDRPDLQHAGYAG